MLVGHRGQAREHIAQISERILAVPLARDDERVDDRRALARVGMADKQPVLLADRRGPDRVFDEVVVQPREGVVLMRNEHLPVVEQVSARLAEARLRQRSPAETLGDAAQPMERPRKVRPAQCRPLGSDLRFVPFRFEAVEFADETQHDVRGLRVLLQGLVEVASCMRPAADAHDALVLALMAGIRAVSIRLDHAFKAGKQRREFVVAP